MISQQQNDINVNEEETPPPHDQKQPSAPTFSWRSWSLWLRVLGVVMPLVASFVYAFIDPLFLLTIWFWFLLGVVCGGLLRSWWAILILPVAFSMGILLSSIFLGDRVFQTILAAPFWAGGSVFIFLLWFGAIPLAIGAAICTPIGKWLEHALVQT